MMKIKLKNKIIIIVIITIILSIILLFLFKNNKDNKIINNNNNNNNNKTVIFNEKKDFSFVFNENNELDRIVNDEIFSTLGSILDFNSIKNNFKLISSYFSNISYIKDVKQKIFEYGNQDDKFIFVENSYDKRKFLIYAEIKDKKVNLEGIMIGDNFNKLKNFFDLNFNEIKNFKVSPLDGGIVFEFYFNKDGILEEIIFRDTYIH